MSLEHNEDQLFELELEQKTKGMRLGDAETHKMKARFARIDEKSRQSSIRTNLEGIAIALMLLGVNQLFPDLVPENMDKYVNGAIIIGGISLISLMSQLRKK